MLIPNLPETEIIDIHDLVVVETSTGTKKVKKEQLLKEIDTDINGIKTALDKKQDKTTISGGVLEL